MLSAGLAAPADVVLRFDGGRLARVAATFTEPPTLGEAIARCSARYGAPVARKLTEHAYETSTVRWADAGAGLTVVLLQTQGTMTLTFDHAAR